MFKYSKKAFSFMLSPSYQSGKFSLLESLKVYYLGLLLPLALNIIIGIVAVHSGYSISASSYSSFSQFAGYLHINIGNAYLSYIANMLVIVLLLLPVVSGLIGGSLLYFITGKIVHIYDEYDTVVGPSMLSSLPFSMFFWVVLLGNTLVGELLALLISVWAVLVLIFGLAGQNDISAWKALASIIVEYVIWIGFVIIFFMMIGI